MNESNATPPSRVTETQDSAAWTDAPGSRATASEADAFLTLAALRGVGPKTLFDWAEAGYSYQAILAEGPPGHTNGWPARRAEAKDYAVKTRELLERLGVQLILRADKHFPARLLELDRPPHWLFVQGSAALLGKPAITIVGTREPSDDGIFLARYVGACLADWGAPTVSGLAAGIDQVAHEQSLHAGVPTIAVLGTGILEDYPRGSGCMRERIVATGGAIVTEYLPRARYNRENFVQRNRLQAALGRVLIPVEWNRRSGTAHTVRFATGLKRPIACLRLPHWPRERVQLAPSLGLETGALFTVPREQALFDQFVRESLGELELRKQRQLSLFDEDSEC